MSPSESLSDEWAMSETAAVEVLEGATGVDTAFFFALEKPLKMSASSSSSELKIESRRDLTLTFFAADADAAATVLMLLISAGPFVVLRPPPFSLSFKVVTLLEVVGVSKLLLLLDRSSEPLLRSSSGSTVAVVEDLQQSSRKKKEW
ncbi:hypothetical protein TYRP_007792 [Tyrophagus putrescentiae]|nr:hypothetical protein TYRP_007792 [Tyrophagus putrescentiae]